MKQRKFLLFIFTSQAQLILLFPLSLIFVNHNTLNRYVRNHYTMTVASESTEAWNLKPQFFTGHRNSTLEQRDDNILCQNLQM